MIRPGPSSLEPGLCPGGVVVRVYRATVPDELVIEQRLEPGDDIEFAAQVAALLAADGPLEAVLVAYDGDTGERYSPEDWRA